MISVGTVAAALSILQPQMSKPVRVSYARVLVHEAKLYGVDPLDMAVLVDNESRWNPRAGNGKCVGLGAICLPFRAACALGLETASCLDEKERLLDGAANLHEVAKQFANWKRYCRKKTGRSGFAQYLSGYGGFDGKGVTCGQRRVRGRWVVLPAPPTVKKILARRAMLELRPAQPRAAR